MTRLGLAKVSHCHMFSVQILQICKEIRWIGCVITTVNSQVTSELVSAAAVVVVDGAADAAAAADEDTAVAVDPVAVQEKRKNEKHITESDKK